MRSLLFRTGRRRALWIGTVAVAAVAWCGFVAARAVGNDNPPNTGMGDPAALVNAYDRFAAGGDPPDVVTLSLSNLRGLSSEAVNAGGQVTVNLATGTVNSLVQLLPADGTFDLWLIDNKPGAGHTTFAQQGDDLLKVGTYAPASGGQTALHILGVAGLHQLFSRSRVRRQVRREPGGRLRADRAQHPLHEAPSPSGPLRGSRERAAGLQSRGGVHSSRQRRQSDR